MDTIGARVKYVRQEVLGVSQQKFAKMLNVSRQNYISRYERDRQIKPHILVAIARIGKTSVHWLITGKHFRLRKQIIKRIGSRKRRSHE